MHKVRKNGWNSQALILGPFWYIFKGMISTGIMMLVITLATLGIGLIPIWIYCGAKGNSDHYKYLKAKGVYIYPPLNHFEHYTDQNLS